MTDISLRENREDVEDRRLVLHRPEESAIMTSEKMRRSNCIMKIICMGDSITYGFGLMNLHERWSDVTQERTGISMINCGVSGDTTGGMLARCQTEVFGNKPDAMILLGGINDASILGEIRPIRANVISIYRQCMAYGVPVILGIPLPVVPEDLGAPSWEPDRDNAALGRLCAQYADWIRAFAADNGIPTVDFRTPFLLPDGTANGALFQDGLHPTAEGHAKMADALCAVLQELHYTA